MNPPSPSVWSLCRRIALACLALATMLACQNRQGAEPSPSHSDRLASHQTSPQGQSDTPMARLYALDTRRPVPLQPMMAWHQKQTMMQHLVAIEQISSGLAGQDWNAVAEAAATIGSSPQMQQMCQHMGEGADGFTDMGLEFHRRADQIGAAAKLQDGPGVLRALSSTLQACNNCHSTFRQDVVDAATWQAQTGMDHDPFPTHHGH
ncbi:MAG: hypothetical protein AAFS10_11745 [Myxococcota bacterium]